MGNKWDVCTDFDKYMKKLCHREMMISWEVETQDGLTVYGDYEREGYENPWFRLKKHCEENKAYPTKVSLYMMGCPPHVFFEDPNGLDGLNITRGVAKEQSMTGDHSNSFQFLTVCLLDDDCEYIEARKFVWPHNEFEQAQSKRILTTRNLQHMIFKHDSQKLKNPKVQKYLNGSAM